MTEQEKYLNFNIDEILCQEISDPDALVREPVVSVTMITYNHEPYIAQAIEGVLLQEVDFPYELVIGEDCSTDATREIVLEHQKKYPDIIRVITSDMNVGARKNSIRTLKACRGKYLTFCDGDDYWCHPEKLQKQVDFLESNPDYGLVHSDYNKLINKTGKIIEFWHKQTNVKIPDDNSFEKLLVKNCIATSTVCARSELVKQAKMTNVGYYENWMSWDRFVWMEISRHSKIEYIDEPLSVYRRREESISNSKDIKKKLNFIKSSYDMRFYFIDKYGCSEKIKNIVLRDYHRRILPYLFLLLDDKNARKSFEFLQTVENSRKERARSYYYYFGSRNRLNWIVIRALCALLALLRILRLLPKTITHEVKDRQSP
jgi:glycosyltransferase involved in cell wall biosynthesis